MICFLHRTLKRDLLNVVWISSGSRLAKSSRFCHVCSVYFLKWKDFIPYEPSFGKIEALTLCMVL